MAIVRKRPFTLFYGESTRVRVDTGNYHMRSRATCIAATMRAAITRLHITCDAKRVDVYDLDDWHVATITRKLAGGYDIKFTDWAIKQYNRQLSAGTGSWGIY